MSRVAALLLAAGMSARMGTTNKLAAVVGGRPMVRIAADAALESRAVSLTVVTGHKRYAIETALEGLDYAHVHNPDYADGLSTSLHAGLRGLPNDIDGVVVLLGDMPEVTAGIVDILIEALQPDRIVVPTSGGQRGNPVVWSRRFFPDLLKVTGDTGGRQIIESNRDKVTEVEIGAAVGIDVDTPEALAAAGGRLF